jgi:hypothetical protein
MKGSSNHVKPELLLLHEAYDAPSTSSQGCRVSVEDSSYYINNTIIWSDMKHVARRPDGKIESPGVYALRLGKTGRNEIDSIDSQ